MAVKQVERDALILELRAKGLSFSDVAKVVGGISRSVVSGVVNRASGRLPPAPRRPRQEKPEPIYMPPPPAARKPIGPIGAMTIDQIQEGDGCRWPTAGHHHFCGDTRRAVNGLRLSFYAGGKPYCDKHDGMAWSEQGKRRSSVLTSEDEHRRLRII